MQKLLYIAPHLSTGGLPQYLVKKIELLKNEYEIYLVEYSDHSGGKLVIQKNKILDLVDSDKFYTLGENKTELLDIIQQVSPDILHLEEIPEYFLDPEVAKKIYIPEREYFIVETSHDSSFNVSNKQFFPDKFMFVSQWQIDQYQKLDIPKVLVEYPIEYFPRPDRTIALKKLGLDPNKQHVLHVGLFTPRKNQEEFFDYARMFPDVEFHCLGNQASNFRFYWEPLMENKPKNVTWWDERKDVENFYQSMDLFLFTSRGTQNNKETMPLVIREAISYQIPTLIYNLDVYQDYFDKFPLVNYLQYDDLDKNNKIIAEHLGLQSTFKIDKTKEAYVISTYPVDSAITKSTLQCIRALKKDDRKIIVTSHAPVPDEIQRLADYVIYDSNNILVEHTHFESSWVQNDKYKSTVYLKGEGNNTYHGPTVYTNYYNAAVLAQKLNIEKLYFINYDYVLNNISFIDYISGILNKKDGYFYHSEEQDGKFFHTYFCASKPSTLLNNLPPIFTGEDYQNLTKKYNTTSNSLENIFYHLLEKENFERVPKDIFEKDIEDYFDFLDHGMIEHFTILPTNKPNYFCPWVRLASGKTLKDIHYTVTKNGEEIINRSFKTHSKFEFWDMIPYTPQDKFFINFSLSDTITGKHIKDRSFTVDYDYLTNIAPNNGLFEWKNENEYVSNTPKIKLMHLVTEPDSNPKEIRSIESVKDFCNNTGIKYEQRVNKIWKDLPPKDTCNRPNDIQEVPGYYKLAPGHYGCYLAHRNALLAEDNNEYDYVLIFEGDVIVDSDYNELFESLKRFSRIANETDQDIIGFGNPWQNRNLNGPKVEDIYTNVTPFVPAQSYLINREKLPRITELIYNTPWDAFDLWVCNVANLRVGTAEKIYTKHLPGFSIVEQEDKATDNHSPLIFAKE